MSRSILLQLARDSIVEVFQAQNNIERQTLLQKHPLLHKKIPLELKLILNEKSIGSYSIGDAKESLLESIILAAKKAAFEDDTTEILTLSNYLACEIELTLYTEEGILSQKDEALI